MSNQLEAGVFRLFKGVKTEAWQYVFYRPLVLNWILRKDLS